MKVNMISETTAGFEGNGVHSAFLDVLDSLQKSQGVQMVVNSKEKADIIHSHTIGPLYVRRSWGKKERTLISAHVIPESMVGSLILSKYWLPLFKIYLKFAYNHASTVLAVSPTVKRELEKMGIKAKVVFLPNSINREQFQKVKDHKNNEFRIKYNIKEDEFVVLCVGQIQTRKGVKDFIDTAAKMPDVKFIWGGNRPFGKLTAGYQETEDMIKNAPTNVIFTGFIKREEISKLYNAADVFFFPSFQENHPVAVIEAASIKIPIILRDINEYKDIFFDFYMSGKNVDNFIECIKKLKEDKNTYEKYSDFADKIAEEYDVKTVTKKLLAEYQELINKSEKNKN